MRPKCPKCDYEKCTTKVVVDNPKYPSGVILRCKNANLYFQGRMKSGYSSKGGIRVFNDFSLTVAFSLFKCSCYTPK